jgi:hypothetical protein
MRFATVFATIAASAPSASAAFAMLAVLLAGVLFALSLRLHLLRSRRFSFLSFVACRGLRLRFPLSLASLALTAFVPLAALVFAFGTLRTLFTPLLASPFGFAFAALASLPALGTFSTFHTFSAFGALGTFSAFGALATFPPFLCTTTPAQRVAFTALLARLRRALETPASLLAAAVAAAFALRCALATLRACTLVSAAAGCAAGGLARL